MLNYRLTAVYGDLYSTIICSIICNEGLFELMCKAIILLCYTFYEFNHLSTLFVQDIALVSQRDVKTMLSIITSSGQELLNVFFNKVLIFLLMSESETYFNANIAAPI